MARRNRSPIGGSRYERAFRRTPNENCETKRVLQNAAATDVQKAVTSLGQNSDKIAAKAAVVAGLENQAKDAKSALTLLRRDWQTSHEQVLNTVKVFAAGFGDVVKELGFELVAATPAGLLPAPSGLTATSGKNQGEVKASWKRGDARHGFVVQHATDPANAATYSALKLSTRMTCTLGGLQSGIVVHVRVAAVDPRAADDQGPWSIWVAATVR